MTSRERVLFVHAHPDDAATTTGGTIATLVDAGAHVTVVTCTRDGRGDELAHALRVLGVTDQRYLGDAGARWQGREPRQYTALASAGPETISGAAFGEVSADIAAVISDVKPTVVISYNEAGGYGQPDHIRVHQAARRAAEVMNVAFYAVEPEGSAATPTMAVDVAAALDRKREAIAAHASRLQIAGNTVVRATGERTPIAAVEFFRRVREPQPQSSSWRDLSIASKIGTCMLAVVLGGAAGLLMTAVHQSTALVAGVPVPWGIIVALVSSIALLAGFRIAYDTRVLPALAAFALLGVAAILAGPTRGGSVVVPANLAGLLWTIIPPAAAFIVLAWPRIRRSPARRIELEPAVKGSSIQ